jgi:hypothetical protein
MAFPQTNCGLIHGPRITGSSPLKGIVRNELIIKEPEFLSISFNEGNQLLVERGQMGVRIITS